MKIAIIGSRGYPYVYSGYETFVKELGERLARRGIDVTVYCHRGLFTQHPRQLNGLRLVYLPTIESKVLSQFLHSVQAVVHACFHRFDLILAVNSANGPFGLITRLFGIPTVINVDGLEWLRPKWRGMGARYFRWASRMATKWFDGVVTDSEEMRKIYLREFAAESTMIAYGGNIGEFSDPAKLSKWGLFPGEYYLIVGRLVPDNNAGCIIREFIRSTTSRKLVIVGDVPYADPYARSIKRENDSRLVFTGYVNDGEELAALYQHCCAYFHGHEFGGTNPSLLQALAQGCAVIALDTVFSREVLVSDQHGLYFGKEEGSLFRVIEQVEANPQVLADLRVKARDRIREAYTWDRITDQYCQLFENLLKTGYAS